MKRNKNGNCAVKHCGKYRVLSFVLSLLTVFVMVSGSISASNTPDSPYFGFNDGFFGCTTGAYNTDTANKKAKKLYVSESTTFLSTEDTEQRKANAEIAYCFNATKKFPSTNTDGTYQNTNIEYRDVVGYDKVSNVTAEQFETAASNNATGVWSHSTGISAEEFRKRIITIGLNGYPHDMSQIGENSGLTDEQLWMATQYAIWYYTDEQVYNQYVAEASLTNIEKQLINALINAPVMSDEMIAGGGIAFSIYNNPRFNYVSGGNWGIYSANYDPDTAPQILLSVGKVGQVIEPVENVDVVINAKKLLKDGETVLTVTNDQFSFVLKDSSGNIVANATNNENGDITFEVTCPGPGEYHYTVEEVNDGQDGINYDETAKEVTVTVTANSIGTSFDSSKTYYGYDADYYADEYYMSETPTGTGTRVYCTYQPTNGPKDTGQLSQSLQTYSCIINPEEIVYDPDMVGEYYGDVSGHIPPENVMVFQNIYNSNAELEENLKKIFYFLQTDQQAQTLEECDKQKIVWAATGGNASAIINKRIVVNGNSSNNCTVILNNIYASVTVPDGYNLAFFLPTAQQRGNNRCYQPLATGYFSEFSYTANNVTFTNTVSAPATYNLTITKNVGGNFGDKNKDFNFRVVLNDTESNPITGIYSGVTFDANGEAIIQLSNGEMLVIEGLPENVQYTVEELNASDYVTTVNDNAGKIVSGTLNEDKRAEFVNIKEVLINTGITDNLVAFMVLTFTGLCGVGALAINRRRCKDAE